MIIVRSAKLCYISMAVGNEFCGNGNADYNDNANDADDIGHHGDDVDREDAQGCDGDVGDEGND